MAAWSEFLTLVLPEAQGCPDVVAEAAARSAAIEFCEKTLCLQRDLVSIPTVVGQAKYVLSPLASAVFESGVYDGGGVTGEESIERLLSATVGGKAIVCTTPQQVGVETASAIGAPELVFLAGASAIYLAPIPSIAGRPIAVRAAMRPSQRATELDDDVFERFAQAIASGAISRLCSTRGRTYTEPNRAAEARISFQEAVDSAREGVFRSNTRRAVARMRAL